MRSGLVPICIIAACAIFSAGCTGPGSPSVPAVEPSSQQPDTPGMPGPGDGAAIPTITPQTGELTINASPERYSPLMSSTVGIRLTPHYETSAAVVYNWTTNYGYFVSWNATDGRVTILDRSVETEEHVIFWSYPPDDMGIEKPSVTVRLIVQTARMVRGGGEGRETFAWKDIHIAWEDTDTAVVET